MLKNILLAFIPIFVAVDAIGVLPIFISLTAGLKKKEKNRAIMQSVLTASCLAVGFIFLGKAVFRALNITVGDFMVAGGFVLFFIAIVDLVFPGKKGRMPADELGVVPLGTPLIVGPAVLTTSLIIIDEYGITATLISVIANILLAGGIFANSQFLIRSLGESGSRAMSKVTSLLLVAIAVMLIRKGLFYILSI